MPSCIRPCWQEVDGLRIVPPMPDTISPVAALAVLPRSVGSWGGVWSVWMDGELEKADRVPKGGVPNRIE